MVETADGESMLLERAGGLCSDSTGLNTSSTALTRKVHTIGASADRQARFGEGRKRRQLQARKLRQ